MPASLIAPLLVIKAPKKMVFIVFGSIASFSQATSNISYQNINIFLEIAIRSYYILQLLSSNTCQKVYLKKENLICMTTFRGYRWLQLFWLSLAQDVSFKDTKIDNFFLSYESNYYRAT